MLSCPEPVYSALVNKRAPIRNSCFVIYFVHAMDNIVL